MDQEAECTPIPITEEVREIMGQIIEVVSVTENFEAINIVSDNRTSYIENEENENENSLNAMVMDSIQSLKKSNGASIEDIEKHMNEKYAVNVKALLKYNVNNFLQKCVDDAVFEKIGDADAKIRFKIKEKY